MDNRFNIDFEKFAEKNIPEVLKKEDDVKAWVSVLFKPLVSLYQKFLLFGNAILYDIAFTGQVCSLERMLNDRYDSTLRRIYIGDGEIKPTRYIYRSAELKPVYIRKRSENAPIFIYTSGENSNSAINFIVYVPLDIQLLTAEIISLIKLKRLVGKRFKIQRF